MVAEGKSAFFNFGDTVLLGDGNVVFSSKVEVATSGVIVFDVGVSFGNLLIGVGGVIVFDVKVVMAGVGVILFDVGEVTAEAVGVAMFDVTVCLIDCVAEAGGVVGSGVVVSSEDIVVVVEVEIASNVEVSPEKLLPESGSVVIFDVVDSLVSTEVEDDFSSGNAIIEALGVIIFDVVAASAFAVVEGRAEIISDVGLLLCIVVVEAGGVNVFDVSNVMAESGGDITSNVEITLVHCSL